MEMRIAASKIMKFRFLLKELGLYEVILTPTKLYCDSKIAISWEKTGKITTANQYFGIDYHQTREWEHDGHLIVLDLHTADMVTDLGTKAVTETVHERLYPVLKGYAKWVITHPRETMTFT